MVKFRFIGFEEVVRVLGVGFRVLFRFLGVFRDLKGLGKVQCGLLGGGVVGVSM